MPDESNYSHTDSSVWLTRREQTSSTALSSPDRSVARQPQRSSRLATTPNCENVLNLLTMPAPLGTIVTLRRVRMCNRLQVQGTYERRVGSRPLDGLRGARSRPSRRTMPPFATPPAA